MKAVCWMGKHKIETLNVPDPILLNPHDAIIKVTRTAICGSDLHLYDGFIPTMEAGDILGHEFMGIVEEVGKEVTNLKRGRPRRRAVHHRVRKLPVLQEEDLVCLRQHQSQRASDGSGVRLFRLRAVRLFAHDGRLCRRAGAVCACSVCECRPAED